MGWTTAEGLAAADDDNEVDKAGEEEEVAADELVPAEDKDGEGK